MGRQLGARLWSGEPMAVWPAICRSPSRQWCTRPRHIRWLLRVGSSHPEVVSDVLKETRVVSTGASGCSPLDRMKAWSQWPDEEVVALLRTRGRHELGDVTAEHIVRRHLHVEDR